MTSDELDTGRFKTKIWHSAIWGFSVKAAFSCQTSRWWRSTQKWMEWGIWRHHYWHYYLAAHRIQQPIQNFRHSEILKFRIMNFHVFFLMEEHPKMNGMRNLKTSLLTLLLSCCSPDPGTNSESWIFTNFQSKNTWTNNKKWNGIRNFKTSLLPLTRSSNQFRSSKSWNFTSFSINHHLNAYFQKCNINIQTF